MIADSYTHYYVPYSAWLSAYDAETIQQADLPPPDYDAANASREDIEALLQARAKLRSRIVPKSNELFARLSPDDQASAVQHKLASGD